MSTIAPVMLAGTSSAQWLTTWSHFLGRADAPERLLLASTAGSATASTGAESEARRTTEVSCTSAKRFL